MAWQTPKTDWTGADGVRFGDINRIEGNILDLKENKVELSDFNNLREAFDNAMYDISNRVSLQSLPVGTEFGLHENGILVPFIKLADNYESSGRVLAVRKDCLYISQLLSGNSTVYEDCLIDIWLNGPYIETLNSVVQNVLSNVGIKSQGTFSMSTINRKVFILSISELQLVSQGMPIEGSSIAYFNTNARRVSRISGSTTNYWTRTINTSTGNACYVSAGGTVATAIASEAALGIRPALTLPGTLEVTTGIPNTTNVMATAEVI